VADLGVPRDPSRVPLLPVIFTHVQKYPPGKLTFAGCSVEYQLNPRSFETFELDLNVVESPDALELKIHGNSDLYSERWLELRTAELERLLEVGCRAPDTAVDALELLPDDEWTLVRRFNETAAPVPGDATIARLFEDQAARTPGARAIRCGPETVRYGELDARANRLARLLRGRGIRRGVVVGLCLSRSIDMVVAMLAVLKAGGAYLPLDPGFPAARLAFMVEDSGLALVVSESDLAAKHGYPAGGTLDLDRVGNLGGETDAPLPRDGEDARPDDLAYLLYTSGSTGKPKGVGVHHRAAVNFLVSMQREPGIAAADRLLAVTTLSFDIALLELMLPLIAGAEVVLATRDEAMDGDALQRRMQAESVTMMQATPATWRMLVDSGWKGAPGLKALCGGEALPLDLAEALVGRVGELWNMYGPTETTVWSTCGRVSEPRSGITIGRPIANTSVWVLDSEMHVCPIGVPGEMYIGGEGVARQYLHRAELTRERFVADPFSRAPGARMYRTGDLGRWRADGRLECLGRTDFQVKVRGYRVELGEIEARLAEHAAVREACVVVRESAFGDSTLVAYFAPRPGHGVTSTDLRAHLRGTLPDYMLPQAFVELPELPRTANGKLDRKALPAPFATSRTDDVTAAPSTDAERLVAAVWQELLGRSVGAHENFFEAGGHSLLVVQAIVRIAERTGVQLSPRAFAVDTLAQIAARIGGAAPKDGDRRVPSPARSAPEHGGLFGRIKSRLFG